MTKPRLHHVICLRTKDLAEKLIGAVALKIKQNPIPVSRRLTRIKGHSKSTLLANGMVDAGADIVSFDPNRAVIGNRLLRRHTWRQGLPGFLDKHN